MNSADASTLPEDFRYKDVFLRGRPQHSRYDPFRIRHPEMTAGQRAKIFSPFSALKGFGDAVASKDVLYEDRREPEREDREELDRRLRILRSLTRNGRTARENRVTVSVTYFVPCTDENSESFGLRGRYQTVTGICRNVDPEVFRTIRVGGTTIALEDILRIESAEGIFGRPREPELPEGQGGE